MNRTLRIVFAAAGVSLAAWSGAGCGVPADEHAEPRTRPERSATILVAPEAMDCLAALPGLVQLATDLLRMGREVEVFRADGTGAGAAPLLDGIDQSVVGANDGSQVQSRSEVVALVTAELEASLCPVAGTLDIGRDQVELLEAGVRRAIADAAGRTPELYVYSSGVHVTPTVDIRVAEPPPPTIPPSPFDTSSLKITLVGFGDFSGLEQELDSAFVRRVDRFGAELCRLYPECSVMPTFHSAPQVKP